MNHKKSVVNNFIFNFIKTLSTLLFPIITFTYSAKILGVRGVGKVNFVRSIIAYFIMFALLGTNYYGTREVAKLHDNKNKLNKFVHEILLINVITTILAYIVFYVCVWKVTRFQDYKILLLINSISIILQGMGMEWLYQGLEEYRYIAVRSMIFQVTALLLMVLFVKKPKDIFAYAIIYIFATSGSYVLNFVHARKYISFYWIGHYNVKRHLRPLLWLFSVILSIELYAVLDSTMLGFFKGDISVGKYTAAVKVNKMVNSLITSLGVVMIPRISYYIELKQIDRIKNILYKTYNFVFMLSVPACIGLFCLSKEIILIFSGEDFLSASTTMRIMTPIVLAAPFSVATNQQTFVPLGKEKLILISTCAGAITNIICNLILIPLYAENGAAIATVLAEMMVAIICFCNIKRYFGMRNILSKYYQYWVSGALIPIIVYLFRKLNISYVIEAGLTIVCSILVYFVALFLLKNPYLYEVILIIRGKITKAKRRWKNNR